MSEGSIAATEAPDTAGFKLRAWATWPPRFFGNTVCVNASRGDADTASCRGQRSFAFDSASSAASTPNSSASRSRSK